MEIKVYSGKYRLVDSNTIFLFYDDDELIFDVKASLTLAFKIFVKFEENESGQRDFSLETENNKLIFTCTNFEALGAGTTKPIELATIGGKRLYFHFWAYRPSKSVRKVEYSIFIEEAGAKDNG